MPGEGGFGAIGEVDCATITDCTRGLDGDLRAAELEPGSKLVTDRKRRRKRRGAQRWLRGGRVCRS